MSENLNSQVEVVAQAASPGLARRRLIRAGLAAAPVVLSLSGRSAMATVSDGCGPKGLSPLAWNSISPGANGDCIALSRQPGRNTLGRSPGFWKPNTGPSANVFQGAWPWNKSPAVKPFSAYQGGSYTGILSTDTRWATGTEFGTVIPTLHSTLVAGTTVQSLKTVATSSISRLLIDNNASPIPIKLACALLNALTYSGYAMTVAEVLFLAANKQLVAGGPTLSDATIREFLDQTWS